MNLKRISALILSIAMIASFTGCGNAASSAPQTPSQSNSSEQIDINSKIVTTSTEKVNIIWSHNASEKTSIHKAALKFKELIEERSGGNITIEIYANGDLGSVPENDQALREGTIQIGSGTSGGQVDMSLAYFDAPNLVTSNENGFKIFGRDTELRLETEKRYDALGMKLLSFVPTGFRVTSSNKPIRTYEDIKGLNIRTLENPIPISYWKSWGANPTPIAFSELYIALQQGLVEAQENPYDAIVASKLYEQQKYIINTNHIVSWSSIVMNADFYNRLPADYQKLISDVWITELDEFTYNVCTKANDDAKAFLQDQGIEIIDLPEEDLIKMREEAKEAYALIRKSAGDEIMDKIEKVLNQN